MATSTRARSKPKGKPGQIGKMAANQTRDAASTAADAVQDVAGTAKQQATQVAGEAAAKAQDLFSQVRDEIGGQTDEQARRLAVNLRRVCGELSNMADAGGEQGSPAYSLVHGIAAKGSEVADFLESRGAGGMVAELQALGRRRPGTFLMTAMAAGVAAGRVAKATRAANDATPSAGASRSGRR